MKRVLHYVGKMNRGGMETFIMNLYRNIDRERIGFDFAVHGDKAGDFEEEILDLGGKFFYFPHMRKNPIAYRKAWHSFWKKNGSDYAAFHMHTNSLANVIALEEAAKAGVPIRIIHSHSSMANKGKLQWLNDFLHRHNQKRIPELATDLFACSDKAAEWLFGENAVDGIKVVQINNGVDVEKFKFNKENRRIIREKFGFDDTHKVIGHIGAFIPVKNHRFLVDVVEKAYMMDNTVRCLLVGNGVLFEEVKAYAEQKSLSDVIVFAGVCDNVNELLSAMDVFVMPSLYEGLPVSLVEVQANGLPAVVSDTITTDVKMQKNLHYLSITLSPEIWAKEIEKTIANDVHSDDYSSVRENGFDIIDTVKLYENTIMRKGEQQDEQAQ